MAVPVIPVPLSITSNDPIFANAHPNVFTIGDIGFPYNGVNLDPFKSEFRMVFGSQSPYEMVEELPTQRPGTPFSADLVRTYVRRFRVIVRNKYMGAGFVCRCPGLPVPFAPYIPYRKEEFDAAARAVNITADTENADDWKSWVVTVTYSTEMPPWGHLYGNIKLGWDSINGFQNAPWRIPPRLDYEGDEFTKYPLVDLDNLPFVNSAGQPIVPSIGVTDGNKTLIITRFERDFETRAEDYHFVTNSVTFKGSPTGYALCRLVRATQRYVGRIPYHEVVYRVTLRKKIQLGKAGQQMFTPGFEYEEYIDQGMYQRAAVFGIAIPGTALVPITRFGQAVTNPVFLDGAGLEQTEKIDPTDPNSPLKPVWIKRRVRRKVDLNVLIKPQS